MTKIIAFYLPQFHTIPENDQWWGKGFTEWTNTRKSKPLFWKHYQPRIPVNQNYYDLSDVNVMKDQALLAKKYGLGGFCFYHYWFNGKKLLEEPIENYLNEKSIHFPFCISWANEPWTRTWDGVKGANEILMEQSYGDEKSWEEHFDYLKQFFLDDRYIKLDNKPVFIIYRAESIPECERMLLYWDQYAKAEGFNGMYFIKTDGFFDSTRKNIGFQARIEFEPGRTLRLDYKKSKLTQYIQKISKGKPIIWRLGLDTYSYSKTAKLSSDRNEKSYLKTYYGAFPDWDNSARKNKNAAIFLGSKPKIFENYLINQLIKSRVKDNEFIFINAWNEWGESAYLEPDQRYGYAYLAAVKRAVTYVSKN